MSAKKGHYIKYQQGGFLGQLLRVLVGGGRRRIITQHGSHLFSPQTKVIAKAAGHWIIPWVAHKMLQEKETKTSQFIRYQKCGTAFLIGKTQVGDLLRGYQFGFGGAGKQKSKYTKNQHGGSFAKVSIAVGKKLLKWLLLTVANKVLN